jgi:hypothetical protein
MLCGNCHTTPHNNRVMSQKSADLKKTCVEMAGRRIFRLLSDFQPAVRQTKSGSSFEETSIEQDFRFSYKRDEDKTLLV